MPRSGVAARRRLQQAALELYRERGFDRTTTAEIAARAGVNERTYFRHFPDKREVLFGGEARLRDTLTQAVADAPAGLPPLEIMLCAFRAGGLVLEDSLEISERVSRQEVIAATPALRERELAKEESITEAIADALRRRGVADRLAGLAAQTGWAAFDQAAKAWIADPTRSIDDHLTQAFEDLRALATTV